jgi:hypothetical protein
MCSLPDLSVAYFYPFEGELFNPSPHISGLIWAALLLSAAVLGTNSYLMHVKYQLI